MYQISKNILFYRIQSNWNFIHLSPKRQLSSFLLNIKLSFKIRMIQVLTFYTNFNVYYIDSSYANCLLLRQIWYRNQYHKVRHSGSCCIPFMIINILNVVQQHTRNSDLCKQGYIGIIFKQLPYKKVESFSCKKDILLGTFVQPILLDTL